MSAASDIARFRFALTRVIALAQQAGGDGDLLGQTWDAATALLAELRERRSGARERTREEAQRVAELDDRLSDLPPTQRLAAVMARTGFKRTKVYRLRGLARNPGKNGIPEINGTRDA